VTERRVGAGLLLAAIAFAVLVGGSQIEGCLGPLGVTRVECARNTGRLPHGSIAQPLSAMGTSWPGC
jgi:hypothetical protein